MLHSNRSRSPYEDGTEPVTLQASSRQSGRSAWTTTRSASGRAGTATSPWRCWRTRFWPSPAPRPPVLSGQRGTRQPERRARPAPADRPRGPPPAGRPGMDCAGPAGLGAGLVQVAPTPSGPRQAGTLPATRTASAAGALTGGGCLGIAPAALQASRDATVAACGLPSTQLPCWWRSPSGCGFGCASRLAAPSGLVPARRSASADRDGLPAARSSPLVGWRFRCYRCCGSRRQTSHGMRPTTIGNSCSPSRDGSRWRSWALS
jgi:hypothetical protein